ncbi:hypothetical protein O3G_MSEX003031 [Manduca sexta]|uniref:Alanine--glyoxylate aminotransferase n=1 Tax=Manduca sexta TaxID=7130 RepID=A0A922CED0_MANSE|nr:hypothetical protein O3G_MSEX003031 [Manduca sexta]KAG6443766.1 hypothetical protein O3G_MSEX003031 [Manduca sexta]
MATYELTVSAPNIEDRSFTKPLLCGPGPCDLWPSVSEALAKPVITPLCDEHYNVIDDIRAGLQYIFQTRNKLVYAVSGSGHSGMETIISNLLGPNEVLLIASRGIWDQRANIIANRYGIKTIIISAPFNTTFSHDTLEVALNKHKPTALFITHGDSSTGTVQNLKGLGEICHRHGAFLLVDTVVSLVGEPFFMDDWGVDAVYTSTQKALSGPAGISPVAFSQFAADKINNRKHEPPFYFDAKLLAQQWNCYGNTRQYHHTLSLPLLWALRQCLREVAKETLPKSWARHAATTAHFHRRIQQMSLQFLVPKPEDRLATVTTIVLPNGYDYVKFYKYIRDKYNILIFAGLGPTVGKALRIGLMGVNSTIEVADAVADAMMGALKVKSLL